MSVVVRVCLFRLPRVSEGNSISTEKYLCKHLNNLANMKSHCDPLNSRAISVA